MEDIPNNQTKKQTAAKKYLVPFTHRHLDMYWLFRGSMKACGFILFLSCSFARKMAFKKENTYIRKLFWKFIPLERNKM